MKKLFSILSFIYGLPCFAADYDSHGVEYRNESVVNWVDAQGNKTIEHWGYRVKKYGAIWDDLSDYQKLWTIHIVGTGSGSFAVTSMSGISVGDTISVTGGGTYTGYCQLSGLNNVVVNNYNNILVQSSVNWDISGDSAVKLVGRGTTGRTDIFGHTYNYGFQWIALTSGAEAIQFQSAIRDITFDGFRNYGVSNFFSSASPSIINVTYTGLVSTLVARRIHFTNIIHDSSGCLFFGPTGGDFTTYQNVSDSVTFQNISCIKSINDEELINSLNFHRMDVGFVEYYGNRPGTVPRLDKAMIDVVGAGDGKIHDIYRYNTQAQVARVFGGSLYLNTPGLGELNVYNVVDVFGGMYPSYQMHCLPATVPVGNGRSYDSGLTYPVNIKMYNNTTAQRYDSSLGGYISGFGWWNDMPNGTTLTIRNNLIVNCQNLSGTTDGILVNNSAYTNGGTLVKDHNIYLAAASLAGVTDSVHYPLTSATPGTIRGAGTTTLTSTGFGGVAWGSPPDIGAQPYVLVTSPCSNCLFFKRARVPRIPR